MKRRTRRKRKQGKEEIVSQAKERERDDQKETAEKIDPAGK
jgi:hypothetical protein